MQKSNKLGVFSIIFSSSFLIQSFVIAQQTNNEYGLKLVSSEKAYRKMIKPGPQNQMVALDDYLHPFLSEIYYASKENFTHQVLYEAPILYIRKEAAQKLALVQDSLKKRGYYLLVYDSYRPYAVTKKMWEIVPDERYAANPAVGSGHNRGVAVDLTLADTGTHQPVLMPTGYDNFSDTAHHGFMQLPYPAIMHRELLKGVMEHFGFIALPTEWWHFSLPNPKRYDLLDLNFEQMKKLVKKQ